jgi:hypothetical protein
MAVAVNRNLLKNFEAFSQVPGANSAVISQAGYEGLKRHVSKINYSMSPTYHGIH